MIQEPTVSNLSVFVSFETVFIAICSAPAAVAGVFLKSGILFTIIHGRLQTAGEGSSSTKLFKQRHTAQAGGGDKALAPRPLLF